MVTFFAPLANARCIGAAIVLIVLVDVAVMKGSPLKGLFAVDDMANLYFLVCISPLT